MVIKDIIYEDFTNYKKPSMFIITPKCSFKCCKEYGCDICQNMGIVKYADIDIDIDSIINKYIDNKITSSIVFGGLEPLDSFDDLIEFIESLRNKYHNQDDVVIYTGYKEEEIKDKIKALSKYTNIILKVGRFIPNNLPHLDMILGVKLSSDNQYAIKLNISKER